MDLALERLTLSYNEMLRVENTGRDRKKVKKLLYYISELSPKHLMKQKMDAYLFYVCVRQYMMADMFEQMSKEEQEIMIELAKRMRTEKPEKLLKEIKQRLNIDDGV